MHMLKKILVLLICLLVSCQKKPVSLDKKPQVVVSIAPYLFFVKKIASDTVDVKTLIPLNANPHYFEPTPSQIELALEAEIWFRIGEPFENYLFTFLKTNNKNLIISDLRQNIELINYEKDDCHHHDDADLKDRHIWLSPKLAKIQAITIEKILEEKFSQNKKFYQKNLAKFLLELDELDLFISQKLSGFKEKAFLISHPAYGYFCKDYGIDQISIESEGKDPSLKKLNEILNLAKDKHVKKVFIQAQYNNRGAQIIAQKLFLNMLMVDPYSFDYLENLKNFATELSK